MKGTPKSSGKSYGYYSDGIKWDPSTADIIIPGPLLRPWAHGGNWESVRGVTPCAVIDGDGEAILLYPLNARANPTA